ncbi:PspC domain-containing protein [Flavobacterium selenitireducens]|uniref:PspC domain-containing protein n=1 Tax=Flavobacterium selenitireducens TaxID=2722704 RepID=UPI00168C0EAF|nr:PspC domain-containing protein [Flavobacterium selenitireducens]MBD3582506.1 PspC domain-containing protein [Flavobacterium selenitireducens]
MNKTVNINLGGMFFHIDEDAYQKLSRYFEAIKRSLNNSTGQDEIIKDIEMRIAEIISEKHAHDKQVINSREVDEVITIMGQPEDYRIEDDGQPAAAASYDIPGTKRMKKLYRDTEKGMVGGVATGLGHYFGIDAVWIKILFLIFVFAGFGTGIIAYFVLWIVTPAAQTTAEKLEMRGEPVNISNIEKKVREEFENVTDKFKNANYGQIGSQAKTGAERVANNILDVLGKIFKAFAKVLGALIVVTCAFWLIIGFISLFTLGSSTFFIDMPLNRYAEAVNYTDLSLWMVATLIFFALGIPTFFLLILGLKLLVSNLKSIGNIAKYTLLALWLISVGILIVLGVKQATEIGYDGMTVEKQTMNVSAGDTLHVKFRYNDYYAKDFRHEEFEFTQDEKGNDVIYSNNVHITIQSTDEKLPYIQIEKIARGKSLSDARKRSEKINYGFTIEGNKLTLDNYLLTQVENKFRKQKVEIYLFVPAGIYLKPDESVENYDWSDDSFFNLHYSGEYNYKVEKDKVRCLDCPADENDWDDAATDLDENDTTGGWVIRNEKDSTKTITIDKNGVRIENGQKSESGKLKSLKLDENGVIIKTE